jgi:hypothetical protein
MKRENMALDRHPEVTDPNPMPKPRCKGEAFSVQLGVFPARFDSATTFARFRDASPPPGVQPIQSKSPLAFPADTHALPPLPFTRHVSPHTAPAGYKYTQPPPRNAITYLLHLPTNNCPLLSSFFHGVIVSTESTVRQALSGEIKMSDPKYAYPYPAQGTDHFCCRGVRL